jgi:hypothetical protein
VAAAAIGAEPSRQRSKVAALGLTVPATLLVTADEVIEELIAHLSCTLRMLRCTEVAQPTPLRLDAVEKKLVIFGQQYFRVRKCGRLMCMGGGPTPLQPVLLRRVLLPWVFGHFIELAPFVFCSRYRPSSNHCLCGFHNRSASRAKVGFFLLHADNDFPYVGNIRAAQSVNVGFASSALLCSYDESKAR